VLLGRELDRHGYRYWRQTLSALQKITGERASNHGFGVKLVALWKESTDRLAHRIEPKYRDLKYYTSIDDLLKDYSVHVVGLVLPIVDMPEAMEKVLITGMCVLSEKPFAPDPTVAARLRQRYTALDASRSVTWFALEDWAWKSLLLVKERMQVHRPTRLPYFNASSMHPQPTTFSNEL
jgi:hypothetical protein